MSRLATRRDVLVLTAVALVVLAGSFGLRWALVEDASAWDVPLYESFGDRIADGEVPYRDLEIEYPPGTLPAFVLPALASRAFGPEGASAYEPELTGPARSYAFWFALGMVVALGATIVATAALLGPLRASVGQAATALLAIGLVPLLLGELSFTRFDALPVALTAGAVALALRRRPTAAGVMLGLAIATKLYPLLLLPLLAVLVARRHGRASALRTTVATLATTALVFLPFLAVAPSEALFPLRAQLARGLQVESLPGSLTLALDAFLERVGSVGIASVDEGGTGSVRSADVVGVAGSVVALACLVVGLAVMGRVWLRWTREPFPATTLVTGCATVLAAQLAFGRVLSPQFVLWALPFVPLVAGRGGRLAAGLLVGALLVTNVWFPGPYREYVNTQDPASTLLLLGRNALLVGLVAVLVVSVERRARASLTSPPLT